MLSDQPNSLALRRWFTGILMSGLLPLASACNSDASKREAALAEEISQNYATVQEMVERHSANTEWAKLASQNKPFGGIPTANLKNSIAEKNTILIFVNPKDLDLDSDGNIYLEGRFSLKINDFLNLRNRLELKIERKLAEKLLAENPSLFEGGASVGEFVAAIVKVDQIRTGSEVSDGETVKVRTLAGKIIDVVYVGDAEVAIPVSNQIYDF
jgi:hypothetical protein